MHLREIPPVITPTLWIHQTEQPALVLGSTQQETILKKPSSPKVEVCKRRSGGGIVLIQPQTDLWIDFLIPNTSALWEKDVGSAFNWLGALWKKTLESLLPQEKVESLSIYQEKPSEHPHLGRLLCFAGKGHGELCYKDRKIVGLSQKRVRHGVRFQSLYCPIYKPEILLEALPSDMSSHIKQLPIGFPRSYLPEDIPSSELVLTALFEQLPDPEAAGLC